MIDRPHIPIDIVITYVITQPMTTATAHTIGVELELVGLSCPDIATVVATTLEGTIEHLRDDEDERWLVHTPGGAAWTVLDDDSLDAPPEARGEINSPILREPDLDSLVRVVEALRLRGA